MSIISEILSGIGVLWEAEKNKINANFVALNADKAETANVPTNTSDLINDSDFVADASYVATDNNFTNVAAAAVIANNAKRSYPATDESRLANTTGSNTGDQDLSSYATRTEMDTALADKIDTDGTKILTDVNYSAADKVLVDTITDKQSKQGGYGLSQNNYPDTDKDRVANLPLNITSSLAGKADLDGDNLVPMVQLPDSIKEGGMAQYDAVGNFPNPGDMAIIYLARDTNLMYRWNGTAYEVLATGEVSGSILNEVELKNYRETLSEPAISSGVLVLDIADGNVFAVELTENVTTVTISNPPESGKGGSFSLLLSQDATGGRTLVWPAEVAWAGGTAPTLTTLTNAIDILTFVTTDAGATWYGILGGANFS